MLAACKTAWRGPFGSVGPGLAPGALLADSGRNWYADRRTHGWTQMDSDAFPGP
jgi:hypothetical protein